MKRSSVRFNANTPALFPGKHSLLFPPDPTVFTFVSLFYIYKKKIIINQKFSSLAHDMIASRYLSRATRVTRHSLFIEIGN